MRLVEPKIYVIGRPQLDGAEIKRYLDDVNGTEWYERVFENPDVAISDAEAVIEFMGRLCYRSWTEGLNANVTRVRKDSAEYLRNILATGHGSVLEHAMVNFVFADVSRIVTHEAVRHRAGTAISQESMRFVRLTDIPFWLPEWARGDEELVSRSLDLLMKMEEHQLWMADHFGLDDENVPFAEKKHKTSFMRRFAPDGVATTIGMSFNFRALRHVIEMRTDVAAEEEIQLVFDKVAERVTKEFPLLFGDYERQENGMWTTPYRKV